MKPRSAGEFKQEIRMLTNEAICQLVKDSFPSHECLVNFKDYHNALVISIFGADGKPVVKPLRVITEQARNEPYLRGVIETIRFYVEDGDVFFQNAIA